MNDTYVKYGIVFLAGVLIGVGGTWLYFGNAGDRDEMESGDDVSVGSGTENKLTADAVFREDNWVVVEDQFPGNQVQLTAVSFSSSGWVAIYEDRDGAPGNILGAQRFDAGEHSGTVDLTRGTEEGQLYYAILHRDDGDRKFDYKIDTQLLDENGDRIEMRFQTPPHRN